MQVGNLSRTQMPREPHDNAALQAMRVLLVIGLMSAGSLALWRFQGTDPSAEGMVAAAPPETITVEPQAANPLARIQVADAEPSGTVLPVGRPAMAPLPEADEEEWDEALAEPAIDREAIGLSHDRSLAVLKQFEAVVGPSSQNKPSKALPAPRTDMNLTGTVSQQASLAESQVAAGNPASSLIDLNRGSVEDLNNLKGAGSLGRAIVRGRPYKSVEDLVTKRVVRRTAFDRIKNQVAVR
jgi:DNA uptake protein ComE-like DNA-binding protein